MSRVNASRTKRRPTQVIRERIATPFYLVQLQGPPPYPLSSGWFVEQRTASQSVGLDLNREMFEYSPPITARA